MPVKIPTYQQQTTGAQGLSVAQPKANVPAIQDRTGQALAGVGQDIFDIGNRLAEAQNRVIQRQDAIEAATGHGTYQLRAENQLRTDSQSTDFTRIEAVPKYAEFLRAEEAKILGEFQGSAEGRQKLASQLTATRFDMLGKASVLSATQQKDRITQMLGSKVSDYAARVRQNPTDLPAVLDTMEKDLSVFAPAMTEPEQFAHRRAATEAVTESSLNWFIERNQPDQAERLLTEAPGLAAALGPEKLQAMFNKIGSAKAAASKANDTVKGIPVSIFNTYSAKDQRSLLGLDKAPGGVFGEGTTGAILQMMADQSNDFSNRNLTEIQDREFLAAIVHYTQPQQYTEPSTGQITTRVNQLPQYVSDALAKRGIKLRPQGGISGDQRTGNATMDDKQRSLLAGVAPALFEGGRTIIELGGVFTGPMPAVQEFLGRTPGLNIGAPDVNEARTNVKIAFKRMVTALQQNPRFAEAERKQIAEDLEVEPKIWDNPASFVERMVGIDRALEGYQRDSEQALRGNISMERRRRDMDTVETIKAFRAKLMPKRLETDQQVEGFLAGAPSGASFVAKNEAGKWTVYKKK